MQLFSILHDLVAEQNKKTEWQNYPAGALFSTNFTSSPVSEHNSSRTIKIDGRVVLLMGVLPNTYPFRSLVHGWEQTHIFACIADRFRQVRERNRSIDSQKENV